MRALLKSAKLLAVILALGWAGFAIYLGSTANPGRIVVENPYLRVSSASAKSGAVFMVIQNGTDADDRLIAAHTDAAHSTELHTHIENAQGVMQMRPLADGVALPAGHGAALERGGDHLMLTGLTRALTQGDTITLTLSFEHAGEIILTVPVDLTR